jgi:hypothetical protein
MPPFFPMLHPGEALYSACARFQFRARFPNRKFIQHTLFGTRNAIAVVDLPCHLGSFVKSLPRGHLYTIDQIINEHTLLPFYSRFIPLERLERIRLDMAGPNGQAINMLVGVKASRIKKPARLRFCPACARNDKRAFGETYWHRLHQVPGVEVCYEHFMLLEDSSVHIHDARARQAFISAEEVIRLKAAKRMHSSDRATELLSSIAKDAEWLLSNNLLSAGLQALRQRYLNLLAERGLATYSGKVKVRELVKNFRNHWADNVLEILRCPTDIENESGWLTRLIRSPRTVQHPLYHLLLIHFLGHRAESFFALPVEPSPFGRGLWPCLNRATNHFGHLIIKECQVTYTKDHGKPVGNFSCDCGFAYQRTGPDVTPEDRFRIDRMNSFGAEWERNLKTICGDKTFSLRKAAVRLGVDCRTVKRHAERLGLPYPHLRDRTRHSPLRQYLRKPQTKSTASRDRTIIHRSGRSLELLRGNTTQPQTRSLRRKPRVDWGERDIQVATALRTSAVSLMRQAGRPIRLTVTSLARETGDLALIQKYLQNLPLTARALTSLTESREQFGERRVKWAATCYRRENVRPKRWQLIRRAGLRSDIASAPSVARAITQALEEK